jgi:hypothetical protein
MVLCNWNRPFTVELLSLIRVGMIELQGEFTIVVDVFKISLSEVDVSSRQDISKDI